MQIFLLVLFAWTSSAQQELCYEGPGDQYSGFINVTDNGEPCDVWSDQQLISDLTGPQYKHNYCRVYQEMSSRPYCVYNGQKRNCDVPICDPSTLLFDGSSLIIVRNTTLRNQPIIAQQINFYFRVDRIDKSEATLVQVATAQENATNQFLSVVLQNGFLKLLVSLDSYNTERVVFGGPLKTGAVHYVSVNRTGVKLSMRLNDTYSNFTLDNQDTTFLMSPYQIKIGDRYNGCMSGLSVGTWVQRESDVKLFTDKPFNLFTNRDISEYTLRRTRKGTPISRMCMFAPATIVTDFYSRGAAAAASGYTIPDDVTENNVELQEVASGDGKGAGKESGGMLDRNSIIIISISLGVIIVLTAVTMYCVRRNQHYTPQGYNLEVM